MVLPADLSTVEVYGTFVDPRGTGLSDCVITFTPTQRLESVATHTAVIPSPITATLNGDGYLSVYLPVTDDPDITPAGWAWEVHERFGRYDRVYTMLAPAGDPIDLTNVAPAVPPEQAPVVPWLTVAGKVANAEGNVVLAFTDLVGEVPIAALPDLAINDVFPVASEAEMLALTAQRGDVAIRTDLPATFILAGDDPTVLTEWTELAIRGDAVTSVAGRTGAITLTKGDVGLSNVDNVSDVNKPVSTATTAAISAAAATKVGKGELVFNVRDYGATGDGATDDTASINAAITAATPTKGVVYFPPGTYVVSMSGSGSLRHAITVAAGITLRGASKEASIIKVAAGVGDYMTVIQGVAIATDLTGLTVEDLTINQNNTNNPVAAGSIAAMTSTNCRMAILAYVGSRMTVRRCRFTDIDSENVVVFNTNIGFDFVIEDNQFDTIGSSVAWHDHSSIYLNGHRQHVANNTFKGTPGGLGSMTAIETHGCQQNIVGNVIQDYYTGANLCGVSLPSIGVVFTSNTIRGCGIGVQLWSRTSTPNTSVYGMEAVLVSDNTIEVAIDAWMAALPTSVKCGIIFDSGATLGWRDVNIVNNVIEYLPFVSALAASDATGAAIRFYRPGSVYAGSDDNILIDGNTIGNCPAGGIYIQPKSTMNALRIRGNLIINPGTNNSGAISSAFKTGITLVMAAGNGTYNDLQVNRNTFIDNRATHVIDSGIDTQFITSCTNAEAVDNVLRVAEAAASVLTVRASASAGSAFFVRHRCTKYVAMANNVLYGSQQIDTVNGVVYTQTVAPSGSTWTSSGPAALLQKANNLSDLASTATARTNLGLGGSATLNVGTTAGTVAAGDDSRFATGSVSATVLDTVTETSLSFVDTTPVVTFTAPASGKVTVDITGDLWNTTANHAILDFRLSGPTTRTAIIGSALKVYGVNGVRATARTVVSGLTPGGAYTLTPQKRVGAGGTGNFADRAVAVTPVP